MKRKGAAKVAGCSYSLRRDDFGKLYVECRVGKGYVGLSYIAMTLWLWRNRDSAIRQAKRRALNNAMYQYDWDQAVMNSPSAAEARLGAKKKWAQRLASPQHLMWTGARTSDSAGTAQVANDPNVSARLDESPAR